MPIREDGFIRSASTQVTVFWSTSKLVGMLRTIAFTGPNKLALQSKAFPKKPPAPRITIDLILFPFFLFEN